MYIKVQKSNRNQSDLLDKDKFYFKMKGRLNAFKGFAEAVREKEVLAWIAAGGWLAYIDSQKV